MGGKPSKQQTNQPAVEADHLDVFMQDSKLRDELEKEAQVKQDASDSEDEGEDLAYSPQEQSGTVSENNRFFKVKRVEIRDPDSGKIVSVRAELILKNTNLAYQIQGYQVPVTWQNEEFIQRKPKVKLEYLLMNYERMKKIEKPTTEFTKLLEFLQVEYVNFLQKAKKMIKDGVITFDAVWYLFRKGAKCFGRIIDDQVVGAEVTNTRFLTSMLGEMFEVSGKCIKSNGEYFFVHRENFYIREFVGVQSISSLSVQPMNEKIYVMLVERGKQFEAVALGHHYKQYGGYILYERAWGTNLFKADGRVMVDIKTFQRMNPEYSNFKDPNQVTGANAAYMQDQYNYNYNGQNVAQGLPAKMTTIQKNVLYMTWPTVAGFSFACKKWGEILVSLLTEIQFDDKAYSRLVLSKEKKNMIKALVDHHQKHRKIFTDIISGKGSGRIFLLHGPPGVGKTLTAEAIAEHLHDPLYSVTVGELGTNTKDLEAKLQEILEVASIWNAVILIDEADIFLEQRNDFDVTRNAMVGIFLRLLEYHQGVLFLTTNRVKCFDEAFHSRISVALRYSELSNEARRRIWHNFLKMVDVSLSENELNQLSQHKINGRQIRTTLQLAQALAQSEKKKLDFSYITRTLSVSNQFEDTQSAVPGEELAENWDKFKFSPTFDDELDVDDDDSDSDNNNNKTSKDNIESKPASKEQEEKKGEKKEEKKKKKKKVVINNNNQ